MKNLIFVFFTVLTAMLFSGCVNVEPVVFAEVFQQGRDEKIRTAYNIWYTDPQNIDCRNVQTGSFIPAGTVIEPVSTDAFDEKITFKAAGRTFVINFDNGIRLCTMRDFIAYTFTKKPLDEQLKDAGDKAKLRIVRGEVVPGMTRKEVLLAWGPPPAMRTPDVKNDTWIYWISDSKTIRLVFRGDVVRQVLEY